MTRKTAILFFTVLILYDISLVPAQGNGAAFSTVQDDYFPDPGYWMGRIEEWTKAVESHSPGKKDPAAVAIGGWSSLSLEFTLALFKNLIKLPLYELTNLPELAGKSIPDYLGIKKESDKNFLLKKGALLHADIALLNLETGYIYDNKTQLRLIRESIKNGKKIAASNGRAQGVWYLRLLESSTLDLEEMAGTSIAWVQDGRPGYTSEGRHMEYGRYLLDSVMPRPSSDEMVNLWYVATAAYGLSGGRRAYIQKHLKDALDVFPSDALILFLAGILHETYATPRYQNALRIRGVKYHYGSMKSELELAQQLFRRAVAADPDFTEARMRLGHVSGLIGDHKQAVSDLEIAAGTIKNNQVLYYASLFLGREQAALGQTEAARQQFERAAMLYPAAQSPLLALSHLAYSTGDVESASAAIERVFVVGAVTPQREDPRWKYDLMPDRTAFMLVNDMRKVFGDLQR